MSLNMNPSQMETLLISICKVLAQNDHLYQLHEDGSNAAYTICKMCDGIAEHDAGCPVPTIEANARL